MGKRRKKTRRDVAEIARSAVEQAIGDKLVGQSLPDHPEPEESKPAIIG